MRQATSGVLFGIAISVASASCAEVQFFGPTPYFSQADSPFAEYLDGPNFYLEDFEDGELNTPGISQQGTLTQGIVIQNDVALTVSVDGDDGIVDGMYTSGHGMAATFILFRPTDPVVYTTVLTFDFDTEVLSALPNMFGAVWTDGPPESVVTLRAYNQSNQIIDEHVLFNFTTDPNPPTFDRFVGVRSGTGIAKVDLTATYLGQPQSFTVDHVQYGNVVPEPTALSSVGSILFTLLSIRFTRYGSVVFSALYREACRVTAEQIEESKTHD